MEKNLTELKSTEPKLIQLIEKAGVVGAGGAGFPTHVKLPKEAEYVIINGAECEPLLRVDQQLMHLEADKLLKALELVVEYTGAREGVIALKKKYHEALETLQEKISEYPNLRIFLLDNFYPAGDEQVIVYEVTGRIVPEGGIPLNVGTVVINVETAINIYEAYYNENPVTDKYVTITGEVREPKTVRVPIGCSVRELLELAGGTTVSDYIIINGGPMMGKSIDVDAPITKTVKGLIVLPSNHSLIQSLSKDIKSMVRQAKTACMHCSLCSEVCPRRLLGHRIEPHKMIRICSYGDICDSTVTVENAFLCCGCRLCEYACVMDLQPWKINSFLKTQLSQKGIKNSLHNQPEKADIFREYKKYPVHKLVSKLGLKKYDVVAPIDNKEYKFDKVTILLKQHVGAPAIPTVQVNDEVTKGQLIAKIPDKALGSNMHASISGKVTAVTNEGITIN